MLWPITLSMKKSSLSVVDTIFSWTMQTKLVENVCMRKSTTHSILSYSDSFFFRISRTTKWSTFLSTLLDKLTNYLLIYLPKSEIFTFELCKNWERMTQKSIAIENDTQRKWIENASVKNDSLSKTWVISLFSLQTKVSAFLSLVP